ncbi:glycerophosphodiester phosphodiesterase family protein [Roseivirga sp. E12]|uniref:glycerophosphodiester phosphodiesterase family protein n=1 Tax=Roseivirga sp. E12 TaxID=2819237 RepID=UPI001ABCE777|nr:glycerophosphodiester phosphodiesterase family protein [Roseivirga sp. E12]MBO3700865.1 glycerophosphodiester phosphodiesterase [Roseivirga sp. E12]
MRFSLSLLFLSFFLCVEGQELDIQGHRGSRGLMPENTIPAFIRAIDEGVTTLELDVVITKDKKVVVSHEAYMSSSICSKPDGTAVTDNESKELNIYQMTYEKVKAFDCGSRGNPRFSKQQKMAVAKPLLSTLITEVEAYLEEKNLPKVVFNIEIKSSPKGDDLYHPSVEEFSQLVFDLLNNRLSKDRFTIQSFDFRVLKYWNKAYPNVRLVALIENRRGVESNLKDLGFIPDVYSPYHILLNKEMVELCHSKNMKVIPWTVNELSAMKRLAQMGVDGIITDYPDRAKGLGH